jgi:hypothetical protein
MTASIDLLTSRALHPLHNVISKIHLTGLYWTSNIMHIFRIYENLIAQIYEDAFIAAI